MDWAVLQCAEELIVRIVAAYKAIQYFQERDIFHAPEM